MTPEQRARLDAVRDGFARVMTRAQYELMNGDIIALLAAYDAAILDVQRLDRLELETMRVKLSGVVIGAGSMSLRRAADWLLLVDRARQTIAEPPTEDAR